MSSAQMKLHCALYTALNMQWSGTALNLGHSEQRHRVKTAIKADVFSRLFPDADLAAELETAMFGLHQYGLIDYFGYFETGIVSGQPLQYLRFIPTVLGCQLFLAANGQNRPKAAGIVDGKITFKPMLEIARNEVFDLSVIQKLDASQLQPPVGPIPSN